MPEQHTQPHQMTTANATRSSSETAAVAEPVAPPIRRIAAIFYDSLLAASVVFAASGVAVAINGDAVAAGETWFQLYLIFVLAAYFVGFWKMAGYTPGMRPWRIKIVTHDGARLSWAAASLRFGYCWLSAIPVFLGYLCAFWARDRLMWHDRLSGTKIIRDASLYKRSTN